jgi:hypothetical protein
VNKNLGRKIKKIWEQKLQKSGKKSQKSRNKNYKNPGIKVQKFGEQNPGTKFS